ncbi:hypothetical protein DID78_07180, partial [Candidatus Marinamargulisbacteria bacterium SCGC AG-343-D04]
MAASIHGATSHHQAFEKNKYTPKRSQGLLREDEISSFFLNTPSSTYNKAILELWTFLKKVPQKDFKDIHRLIRYNTANQGEFVIILNRSLCPLRNFTFQATDSPISQRQLGDTLMKALIPYNPDWVPKDQQDKSKRLVDGPYTENIRFLCCSCPASATVHSVIHNWNNKGKTDIKFWIAQLYNDTKEPEEIFQKMTLELNRVITTQPHSL